MQALHGFLVGSAEGDEVHLEVEGLELEQAVFFQPSSAGSWVFGRVVSLDGGVTVAVQGQHRPDRREFARAWGPVHVRYQPVDGGFELAARRWLIDGQGIERKWLQPELFMNFSGSGLRFDGSEGLQAGGMALVGIRVPGDEREHRFTATVIRVSGGDGGASALHFLDATDGARMALVEFAERIQEQSLGAFDDDEGFLD